MPEGLEAEIWRAALDAVVGRAITDVWVDERVAHPGIETALVGERIVGVRRHGKIVLVDTTGPTLGLHFGMTGRVIVDGGSPIEHLEYASKQDRSDWDRLRLFTASGATMPRVPAIRMNDPRRLGRLTLEPDLGNLGVDVFDLNRRSVSDALVGRRTAIKTALLDQHVIAGLGNLCADEVLWWADLAPHRVVDTLSDQEIADLTTAIRRRLPIMLRRGGSTHGTLSPEIRSGPGDCPRDGSPLDRRQIGGRTAVWCPAHQR